MDQAPGFLRLHATYRYPRPATQIAEGERALENFFEVTRWPDWPGLKGAGRAQLEAGFNAILPIRALDGERRPAILIGTNPLKAGSDWTPWHDEIDPRNGFVRFYGDNKPGLRSPPEATTGNKAALREFDLHGSNRKIDRLRAAPLLFFENVAQESRVKGFRRFRGVGLIDRVERVIQVDRREVPFVNYRFDCTLLTMKAENNALAWEWIAARRDPNRSLEETLASAPASWRKWVEYGNPALDSVRQQLLTYRILSVALGANGGYRMGWVTKASADRGIDFVGRLDLGTNVGPLRVVVAGQAKCQIGGSSPAELSRLAAKLSRGWVGVFITTGYFSQQAQMELQDDGYPILLIDGRRVGELVARECIQSGISTREFLEQVDATYEDRIKARNASEILSDE